MKYISNFIFYCYVFLSCSNEQDILLNLKQNPANTILTSPPTIFTGTSCGISGLDYVIPNSSAQYIYRINKKVSTPVEWSILYDQPKGSVSVINRTDSTAEVYFSEKFTSCLISGYCIGYCEDVQSIRLDH